VILSNLCWGLGRTAFPPWTHPGFYILKLFPSGSTEKIKWSIFRLPFGTWRKGCSGDNSGIQGPGTFQSIRKNILRRATQTLTRHGSFCVKARIRSPIHFKSGLSFFLKSSWTLQSWTLQLTGPTERCRFCLVILNKLEAWAEPSRCLLTINGRGLSRNHIRPPITPAVV
jgi:hypothetical protein